MLKLYRLPLFTAFVIFLPFFVLAQGSDTTQFNLKDFSIANKIPYPDLEKPPFSNAIADAYQLHETGVITRDGHQYFIRIKEPDMSAVIPMPGATPKVKQHLKFYEKTRFYQLPKPILPPLNKNAH